MRNLAVVLVLVTALPCFAQSAAADESDLASQLEEASRIADPASRLQAYDNIVQSYQLGSQSVISVDASRWVGSSRTDPFDDTRTVMLSLDSDAGQDVGGASLVLRYASGKTDVFISWNTDIAPAASVTWRVGSEAAQSAPWLRSDNGRATFYPGDAAVFVRKLEGADRLLARISSPGGDPVVAQFSLQGLDQAIARYAQDIGW